MSPNRFRKIVVLLCIFTLFFVLALIFQINYNKRSFDGFSRSISSHTSHKITNQPYWMPPEVDDTNIIISRQSLSKHPVVSDALKIWPYKGLSSERLDIGRPIRDTRPFGCELINYTNEMKPVSIIIGFHNEFIGVLLRTIHAIVEMTPNEMLLEIILVDDASTDPSLGETLELEVDKIVQDKVRILQLSKRMGLHRALRVGLDKAKGEIVVIMPSYLEPSHGWLPPLVDPVVKDRRTIATPVVEYKHWGSDEKGNDEILDGRGVFDLQLNLIELPVNISIKNFENPIITTNVLVANTEFLKQVSNKKAVTGMDGNLLELSLKTWLCFDGRIVKVPCAKLGHNFKEAGVHDSNVNVGKYLKDRELKRIMNRYFDEYVEQFLSLNPGRFGKAIKSIKNNCTPFKHFLEHIAPDMATVFIDTPPRLTSGTIFNGNADEMCVGTSGPTTGAVLGLQNCTNIQVNKKISKYTFTKAFDIRLEKKNLCWHAYDTFLYRDQNISLVALQPCNTIEEKQRFAYDNQSKVIKKTGTKFCLDAIVKRKFIALASCDETSLTQRWIWK